MKQELANIALDESHKLNGFRVGGILPFYLKYIRTGTHIELCKIQEAIHVYTKGEEQPQEFYNSKLQAEILPLIEEYIVTALINRRAFGWLIRPFLRSKIRRCGHKQLCNLFFTIQGLNEPAFFLAYWRQLKARQGILLREEEQSLENSSPTKKKQD